MQDASAVHAETPLVKLPLVSSAKRGVPSRVLVIYTGGTFGMVRDEHGVLKPAGLGLNDIFKKLPEFQHPVCAAHASERARADIAALVLTIIML